MKKNEDIKNFFKNNKKNSNIKSSQSDKNVSHDLKDIINEKRSLKNQETKKFNESGVMWPEKQEELQKKNEEKKKIIPNQLFEEKNEATKKEDLELLLSNFDVTKMNEEQYNQNRMLNNLNNIYNEDDEDSDNNVEDLNDINSISTNDVENENRLNFEQLKNENENKNENKNEDNNNEDNNNAYESDFQQLEIIRKDLEKDLGEKLLMKVYHYVDDNTDKEVVKIDYDTLREKIKKEFPLKFKFTEKDVEKAIEKIPEVFTIVSKDRLTFI